MNYTELAPSYIRAIAPYQPGKPIPELAREFGLDPATIVKLASNENPLGASPRAIAAMHEAIASIALYPDGNGFDLKSALSQRYAVELTNVVLGNGSNDILELIAHAFLAPGDKAVFSDHAFAVYPLATQAVGATGISTKAKNYGHDLQAMLAAAIEHRSKVVFIANPNNPTGTYIGEVEMLAFLRALPKDILVVLDEAYNEYLPEEYRYDSVGYLKDFPNLIISRTFSKAYGLAGLRVGYAIAHEQVADMLNRVRQPFNVNSVAQAAAVAALQDKEFVRQTFLLNQSGMAQVTNGLRKLGLLHIPSLGNFVSFKVAGAGDIFRRLLQLGVIVRPVANYAMPDFLRVSIGTEQENARFLSALEQAIGESK
ncbi:histidinol-phosphate transaminase [Ferriphaselus sp. R-1]|uniref:histidinol-phosphate transaminase n=1 Tax=Ferriphaselus sp. R-1 TaxID=1485544 RepID=UPI00055085A1|nr:histidinol-phosphate transaminase [Ferriphaselus sp. R-1]